MGKMKITLVGLEELETELERLNEIKFEAVQKKQLTQIFNRAKNTGSANGTPVDTGALRKSVEKDGDEVGYTEDYATHVEYGHSTVVGGYVEGQRFLQNNIERQKEIYKTDLRRAIKGERSE